MAHTSLCVLALLVVAVTPGCKKRANVGPAVGVLVRLSSFSGQTFGGQLNVRNASGGDIVAEGTLTLSLVTDRELCSGTLAVTKASFVAPFEGQPDMTFVPFSFQASAPCPRPEPGKGMNMRVRFEGPGVKIDEVVGPQEAGTWARDLEKKDEADAVMGRVPAETSRLAGVVDVVSKVPSKVTEMSCPPAVKKGAVGGSPSSTSFRSRAAGVRPRADSTTPGRASSRMRGSRSTRRTARASGPRTSRESSALRSRTFR